MAEETEEKREKGAEDIEGKAEKGKEAVKPAVPKKKGGWFQKIPRDILLSPGGMILLFLALLIEIIDLIIPFPLVEQIIELPLEILFIVLFLSITKVSFKSCAIPFLIERIPLISDILPTWLLRMFV
ncbi:MAG TPA: hypothetical protein VMW21_01255 [Patescibacteria group bacterium]|nr:hypothetical protein [Patescibacteria group bacterium]